MSAGAGSPQSVLLTIHACYEYRWTSLIELTEAQYNVPFLKHLLCEIYDNFAKVYRKFIFVNTHVNTVVNQSRLEILFRE